MLKSFLFVTSILLFSISCEFILPFSNQEQSREIPIRSESIQLMWDFDSATMTPSEQQSSKFVVYYRGIYSQQWYFLAEVPLGPAPSLRITGDMLLPGRYVFGVSAITNNIEGNKHTSLDFDAYPSGGWHINWQPLQR